jgi:hypothetical protein
MTTMRTKIASLIPMTRVYLREGRADLTLKLGAFFIIVKVKIFCGSFTDSTKKKTL